MCALDCPGCDPNEGCDKPWDTELDPPGIFNPGRMNTAAAAKYHRYATSAKGRVRTHAYQTSAAGRDRSRRYNRSAKGLARYRAYHQRKGAK